MESIIVACITGVVTLVGVILSNSKSRAVGTGRNDFGKPKPSCLNCTSAYRGRIKRNNTGWID